MLSERNRRLVAQNHMARLVGPAFVTISSVVLNTLLDAARADRPPPTDDEVEAVARIIDPDGISLDRARTKARLILSRSTKEGSRG